MDFWTNFSDKPGQVIWLNYENDFFASTDRYYSQGIAAVYKRPVSETGFGHKLFFRLPDSRKQFGAGVDHMAFTPTSIAFDSILMPNHPYAGTIRGNVFFESINDRKEQSFSWTASAGIIGPEAQGKEIQTGIHKALENPRPKGWEFQIQGGLLLDVGVNARQRIVGFGNWARLYTEESGNFGTARTDATLGARVQFQLYSKKDFLRVVAYFNPAVRFVGHDATLQGSIFNQRSPYTVPSEEITRIIFEREFGVNVQLGKLTASYTFQLHTKQYDAGMTHRYGGLRLGWIF